MDLTESFLRNSCNLCKMASHNMTIIVILFYFPKDIGNYLLKSSSHIKLRKIYFEKYT